MTQIPTPPLLWVHWRTRRTGQKYAGRAKHAAERQMNRCEMVRLLVVSIWIASGLAHAFSGEFFVSTEKIGALFRGDDATIELPLPDGTTESFSLEPTAFLPPDYASSIKTLRGSSTWDSRYTTSIVLTPESISAQVFRGTEVTYLNSRKIDSSTLQFEFASDTGRSTTGYQCLAPPAPKIEASPGTLRQQSAAFEPVLRTFRLAPGATGEFTEYFGSKEEAVRQVVTAMNRAGEIFRREFGISFQLVAGFDRMIFADKDTDPFSSNEPSENLLKETQAAFDSVIGSVKYDVGIVLIRGTYGLAYIRSACDPARKGSSCVGLPEPAGDAFHVNLVTHELGHQFGANHTFNSPAGLCSERRNEWAAFEPGTGSTIMSYSSFPCGDDSFQPRHDAYFHSESIKEIRDYINSPSVACVTSKPSDNAPPTVNAGGDYTIPVGTPFALTATGSDPDGDPITYCWEERDLGPAQTLGAPDNGLSPRFRSFPPTDSPTRILPALEHVLAGTDSPEERLPETNRVLRFRVVARASRDDGALAWADTQLRVTNINGPFRITSHASAQTLQGSTRLEWSTGGTERPPISASQVRISLSTDGGLSFPVVLANATPNDGSEDLVLPAIDSSNARLKVEPLNNIFFDINHASLTIASNLTSGLRLQVARGAGGHLVVSWPASSGTNYKLQRTDALPPSQWTQVLSTNSQNSAISVTVPPSADAAYYRVIQ